MLETKYVKQDVITILNEAKVSKKVTYWATILVLILYSLLFTSNANAFAFFKDKIDLKVISVNKGDMISYAKTNHFFHKYEGFQKKQITGSVYSGKINLIKHSTLPLYVKVLIPFTIQNLTSENKAKLNREHLECDLTFKVNNYSVSVGDDFYTNIKLDENMLVIDTALMNSNGISIKASDFDTLHLFCEAETYKIDEIIEY